MTILLLLATISVDDAAIQDFVASVEKQRPQVLAEFEAELRRLRAGFKQSRDSKAAKDQINALTKDIAALRSFDKRCIGLAAPVLQMQLGRYPDDSPRAGQRETLNMPKVGQILKVEQVPSKATIEGRTIAVRSPHGAIILAQATDLQVDLAEHDSFYLPAIVHVVKIESLKTQAGDNAIIVKELNDLNALEAAWMKRHPTPNAKH